MEKIRRFATVILGLLGLSLIIIGYISGESTIFGTLVSAEIISVLGATLFGASFPSIVDIFLGNDITEIRDYLFRKEKFESAPDHFEIISGRWFVYYLTKNNQKIIWRHSINDFQVDKAHNTISGVSVVQSAETEKTPERRYGIEAGLRGETLIVVNKAPNGSESDAVELIHGIAKTYAGKFLGIQILETWDGDNALTYSIYSREQLVENIDDSENANILFSHLEQLKINNKIVDIGVELAT